MPKMRAAQIARPGGSFEIVEREIPSPAADWVRIKVQACGICHSDSLVKEGLWPGIEYPRVPGHELVGVVDAVGAGVTQWQPGQRVGVGWHGGHCGECDACRHGDFFGCTVALKVTGISFDGGLPILTMEEEGTLRGRNILSHNRSEEHTSELQSL